MSRTTTLQLIAAVVTIALLAVLHQGLDWFFHYMTVDFALGAMVGAAAVFFVWYLAEREDRMKSGAIDGGSTAQQKSARHSIDL